MITKVYNIPQLLTDIAVTVEVVYMEIFSLTDTLGSPALIVGSLLHSADHGGRSLVLPAQSHSQHFLKMVEPTCLV